LVEFVREPDVQIGLDLGPFTRGQELTFPMLVIGTAMMIIYARRRPQEPMHPKRKLRAHQKRVHQPLAGSTRLSPHEFPSTSQLRWDRCIASYQDPGCGTR